MINDVRQNDIKRFVDRRNVGMTRTLVRHTVKIFLEKPSRKGKETENEKQMDNGKH